MWGSSGARKAGQAELRWLRETVVVPQIGVKGANWNAVRRALEEGLGQAGGPVLSFPVRPRNRWKLPASGSWLPRAAPVLRGGWGGAAFSGH